LKDGWYNEVPCRCRDDKIFADCKTICAKENKAASGKTDISILRRKNNSATRNAQRALQLDEFKT
jgi:hypothetical protein